MNSMVADVRENVAAYRAALPSPNGGPSQPSVRLFRPVYVAETTEQALAEGERGYFRFFQLFSNSDDPRYTTPSTEGWQHHTGIALRRLGSKTFEELDDSNYVVFGDPERVRAKLASIASEIGSLDGLVGIFAFGTLSHEQVCRSLRLFAAEVMPSLRAEPAGISA
jgi:alkanesulfonate monooxygenase SsuD/methylene tetrahydromethanopterin reductase-like flavin-dependent oxidoreductase (luciferase family)